MKISKMLLTAAISAGIATTIIAAICTVNHQYPCSHQKVSANTTACTSGQVIICDGIKDEIWCGSETNALEVKQDFPTECISCLTTNINEDTIYIEHYKCNQILSDCYRSVRCKWDFGKCVVDDNLSAKVWVSTLKRVNETCR
jgi:hypothetical protein